MRINNYPLITGKPGLGQANLDVEPVIASPQQVPAAVFSRMVHFLFSSFAPEVTSLPLHTSAG